MPTTTFPETVCRLWLRLIILKCVGLQNLKFVALRVPEIIGGNQKVSAVPRYQIQFETTELWAFLSRLSLLPK